MKENHFETILNCVSSSLFTNKTISIAESNITFFLTEAKFQTVFPLVYSVLCRDYDLSQYQSDYYSIITNNVKITEEHKRLHKLLCEAGIPYVILKGCASARYYPDPLLRTMGDVDFLVKEADFEKSAQLLRDKAYITCGDENGLHIAFKSAEGVKIELHRGINGIPKGNVGEKISALMSDILEKSILEGDDYLRPCDFHHGMVILLHTVSHIKNEGIGLRHICDWAIFVSHFNDNDFLNLFEKPLKEVGLWKFAQILTKFAIKYLGCPQKSWVGEFDEALLQGMLNDILNGGNFGKKDYSRYQHIKYIADRQNSTVNNEGALKRVFRNAVLKAKNMLLVKKLPIFLPIGFIAVIFKYLWLIIIGKRRLDNKQMIDHAIERKNIYSKFELYK